MDVFAGTACIDRSRDQHARERRSNPACRGGKPATNRLSYGAASDNCLQSFDTKVRRIQISWKSNGIWGGSFVVCIYKWDGAVWAGFIWLRIGTSCERESKISGSLWEFLEHLSNC
jgi:hypothetical protein